MISNHVQKGRKEFAGIRRCREPYIVYSLHTLLYITLHKGPPRNSVQSAVLLICIREQQYKPAL